MFPTGHVASGRLDSPAKKLKRRTCLMHSPEATWAKPQVFLASVLLQSGYYSTGTSL